MAVLLVTADMLAQVAAALPHGCRIKGSAPCSDGVVALLVEGEGIAPDDEAEVVLMVEESPCKRSVVVVPR